ncbi:hypothetical protein Harman_02810 [Haloarcula mannanilytica]|uniref:Cell surface protein n=1 Tax=Haloarcula mannanilytica TaxID=2509225 RepID=A0A4C2ECY5_9EURY|nr:cell surface protein [Haloarcula mannanilytica]GCF12346.1 hypothetical protein Harman_02810 [Haloarcula mannanilytica]
MTDSTHLSIRERTVHLALVLAALTLLAGTLPAVAAAQSGPTVTVGNGTVTAGETTTVQVVLTSAPDGLAGYQVELALDDPAVAQFDNASYPDRFALTTDPVVSSDGGTITIEAADLDGAIEPGAGNVTLATVEIAGGEAGETGLTVASGQFDADGGEAIEPATEPTTVTVSSGPTETAVTGNSASATAADSTDGEPSTASAETDSGDNQSTTAAAGPLALPLVLVALGVAAALAARAGQP